MNAAENGLPEAQFEYAKRLEEKGGKNEKTAFLIVSAAENGFAGAFKQAGLYLRNSEKNLDKERAAFFWAKLRTLVMDCRNLKPRTISMTA